MIYNTGHPDRKQSATERPLLCAYSHLEVGYGGRKVKIMTQNVKCGDEVTPLDELSEGSTTEGRICCLNPDSSVRAPGCTRIWGRIYLSLLLEVKMLH